ncbi:NAD(P)-dependent oxidoreductase [Luteolibacter flavescens]|uniref:dTDP-4-dehydrorhamnose reductase n=1 Tax=Luteolibacter flavescens TaxID=1859460 RepID=A0ABT3FIE7_9BACT|nr:NAD(P)-dependent oxidoreductase [Luteolibacter flavescens]MCW1883124.1 NAD(P)-dependent oxidoreductase [Luteolibacter flavescens]
MRLAITGTTGRVGRALADRLAACHEIVALPRTRLDLSAPGCERVLEDLDFDVLLNPAGLTSLEQCEEEPALAHRVNADAPGRLVMACQGRPVLHFSTDYVFDGVSPGLRHEDEAPSPLSVYGKTKAAGESGVLAAGGAVMRVSWVFGPEKPAFPDQIVAKALAGQDLAAVADKYSLPCFTPDLCEWVAAWLSAGCPGGVFHGCQSGEPVSWHGMALEIAKHLSTHDISVPEVKAVPMAEMTAFRAARPRHTAMATSRLDAMLGKKPREWQIALREHVDALLLSR